MSVEDRLAIQEMIARYAYACDGRGADAFAQLFIEDGILEVTVPGSPEPTVRLSSRAEIHEWAGQRLQERTGRFTSRHYQSSVLFDALAPGSALTRTMVLVTHQDVTEVALHLTVSGIYHDQWRKTQEGWRLVNRSAHLGRDPGLSQR